MLVHLINLGTNHSRLQHFSSALDCWVPVYDYVSSIRASTGYEKSDASHIRQIEHIYEASQEKIAQISYPKYLDYATSSEL